MVRHYFSAEEVYNLLAQMNESDYLQQHGLHGPTLDAVDDELNGIECVSFDDSDAQAEEV